MTILTSSTHTYTRGLCLDTPGDNLRELAVSVREAVGRVDAAEAEAQVIKERVGYASKARAAVGKKLASLAETLALSVEKAEGWGLRQPASMVDAVLRQAEEALAGVRQRADGDLEVWMKGAAALAKAVDEVAVKVEAAEEAVDEAAMRHERAVKEREDRGDGAEALAERHDMAVLRAKEVGGCVCV
jgi:hypothetical protein